MSGAIRDAEKNNQFLIETAKRRNERELKRLEANHVDQKADLKQNLALEVVDIEANNHRIVNEAAQKKEKILEEMKSHLHQTKELTDKELKDLKDSSAKQTVETQRKSSYDRERIISENNLYLEDLNDRLNQSARKISYDGKQRIEEVKTSIGEDFENTKQFQEKKIQDQTADFTTRFKHDTMNYKNMKDNQDNQFKKERQTTNVRQSIELSKMTNQHVNHIEQKDGEYRKGLSEQELFFEKKYENQLGRHTHEFKVLDEKNKKVVSALKDSLSEEITKTASRHDDPFFKFETLKPRLKQFEDRVEIDIEVPDHSKQDMQLTTNGKEAIVTFNRRYADANKSVDGMVNKINKIETFTTRIQTGHHLDPKSVKSSYDNGVMTYVLKKA
jgi:HSP20 family molecular chaperone IbpA